MANSPLIIDAHVHLWDESSRYYPALAAEQLRCDAEHLVELQEAAGVSRAVVIQGSADPGEYAYMIQCTRRYPGRFALVGWVNPRESAAAEYIQSCRDLGLSGVRIPAAAYPDDDLMSDARSLRVWEAAAKHDIALCWYLRASQAPQLKTLLERFPSVRVVIDHFGLPTENGQPAPELIQLIADLAVYPRVHVKLSAFPVLSREPFPHSDTAILVHKLLDAFGSHRLMWGTDFPFIQRQCGYQGGLDILMSHTPGLSAKDRPGLFGETARQLFHFL